MSSSWTHHGNRLSHGLEWCILNVHGLCHPASCHELHLYGYLMLPWQNLGVVQLIQKGVIHHDQKHGIHQGLVFLPRVMPRCELILCLNVQEFDEKLHIYLLDLQMVKCLHRRTWLQLVHQRLMKVKPQLHWYHKACQKYLIHLNR